MMKTTLLLLALLTGLSGCNTIAGMGQDVSNGAHSVGRMIGD
ncbi:entericidin A/B family lipoprotein [Thioclava sp. BHET1]|nr:entericidin A/B family lipoprotein [Thioclava sp. BHET1]